MKFITTIIGLFIAFILNAQDVFNLRTYQPISENYYFKGDTLYTGIEIKNNKSLTKQSGAVKIVGLKYDMKVISPQVDGLTISGLEICSMADAQSAINCPLKTITIRNCNIHDCHWGIRAASTQANFNNSLPKRITIINTWIHDTKDDGVFTQFQKRIDMDSCWIYNVNKDYWLLNSTSGGDCLQFSSFTDTIYIRNSIIDHSTSGDKFCLIMGAVNQYFGLAVIENNVFKGVPDWVRERENNTTHTVKGNSLIYFQPFKTIIFRNNICIGGSHGIYEYDAGTCNLIAYNNYFWGQVQAFRPSVAWANNVYNNTFDYGLATYISDEPTDDIYSKNVFYTNKNYPGLKISSYGNYKPAVWTALVDPKTIPYGWGCSPQIKSKFLTRPEVYIDTIRHNEYYFTARDTLIKRDTLIHIFDTNTINYYRKVEILPISIDSVVTNYLKQYFEKTKVEIKIAP